jgi:predicted nucleic acid-binding protein
MNVRFPTLVVALAVHDSLVDEHCGLLKSGRKSMTPKLMITVHRYIRLGLTGCDACYAGLADQLGAKWLTFDRKAHALIADEGASELLEG